MTPNYPAFAYVYLLNTALAVALVIVALRRRHSPGVMAFTGFIAAAALWSFTQFFETGAQSLEGKLFWSQLQYVGNVALAPFWLMFALRYTRSRYLRGRAVAVLWIIPVITLALVWTNSQHGLIWSEITLLPGEHTVAVYAHGPWYWIYAGSSYLMVVSGSFLLVRESLHAPRKRIFQSIALATLALTPLLVNLIYVLQVSPAPGVDFGALAFAFVGLLALPAIYAIPMLELAPVARSVIFDQMDDGILVIDLRGRVVNVNRAAGALLGVPIKTWVGLPLHDMAADYSGLAALGSADAPDYMAFTLETPRRIDLGVTRTTLSDDRGRPMGTLLLLRDLTQIKIAERREFDLALEHERVRLLSRFIQDASHEFRTPLAVVNTSLYLLGKQTEPDQQRLQREKIAAQVERLNQLIEDMITISRLDDGNSLCLEDVDINGLLTTISLTNADREEKQVSVQLELAEALPLCHGDREQLQRAFTNLFANAVQHSASGGSISIHSRSHGNWFVIAIRDNGVGIEPDIQSRIFERFFRKDEAHTTAGMGLGLPMTRAIVEAHGGTIEVQSTPGQGSTFTVRLPRRPAIPALAP
jgi:PAS domain S-box-containing protein